MRYFEEVSLWKIILLNIVVGLLMATPVLFCLIFMFGLFSTPTVIERLIGLGIFGGIIFFILFANFLLWKLCRNKNTMNEHKGKSKRRITTLIKLFLIVVTLLLTAGSFFVPGINELWLKLNGWWF